MTGTEIIQEWRKGYTVKQVAEIYQDKFNKDLKKRRNENG